MRRVLDDPPDFRTRSTLHREQAKDTTAYESDNKSVLYGQKTHAISYI